MFHKDPFLVHCFFSYIYINDIVNVSIVFDIIIYADDTTLVTNLNGFDNIELNSEIDKISLWLAANQLSLNAAKSKYMIFYKTAEKIQFPILTIANTEIKCVESFNFLDIKIYQNLTWTEHVNYL